MTKSAIAHVYAPLRMCKLNGWKTPSGTRRIACRWFFHASMPLIILTLPSLGHAADISLTGGQVARLVDGPGTKADELHASFKHEAGIVQPLPDPRCPARSAVRFSTNIGSIEIELACNLWAKRNDRYLYRDARGAVRKVTFSASRSRVDKGGQLSVKVRGNAYGSGSPLAGPAGFFQAALTIGADTYCGEFAAPPGRVNVNRNEQVVFEGPSQDCGLALRGATPTTTPESEDCTFTQGYWKSHNSTRTNNNQDICWPTVPRAQPCGDEACSTGDAACAQCDEATELCSENTLLCGLTWLDILETNAVHGEAWLILAHQWIAAQLNQASGANTSAIADTLAQAQALLNSYCSTEIPPGADRERATELAGILDDFNNDRSPFAPPICGVQPTATETAIQPTATETAVPATATEGPMSTPTWTPIVTAPTATDTPTLTATSTWTPSPIPPTSTPTEVPCPPCSAIPTCSPDFTRPAGCTAKTLAQYIADVGQFPAPGCDGEMVVVPVAANTNNRFTYAEYVSCQYGRSTATLPGGQRCGGNGVDFKHLQLGSSGQKSFVYNPAAGENFVFRSPCEIRVATDATFSGGAGVDLILDGLNSVRKNGPYSVSVGGDFCALASNERNLSGANDGDVNIGGTSKTVNAGSLFIEAEKEARIGGGSTLTITGDVVVRAIARVPSQQANAIIEANVILRARSLLAHGDVRAFTDQGTQFFLQEGLRFRSTNISDLQSESRLQAVKQLSARSVCLEGRNVSIDSSALVGTIEVAGPVTLFGRENAAEIKGRATIVQRNLAGDDTFSVEVRGCQFAKVGEEAKIGTRRTYTSADSCTESCATGVDRARSVLLRSYRPGATCLSPSIQVAQNAVICAEDSIQLDSAGHTVISQDAHLDVHKGTDINGVIQVLAAQCGPGSMDVAVDPVEICASGDITFDTVSRFGVNNTSPGGDASIKITRTTKVISDAGNIMARGHSCSGDVIVSGTSTTIPIVIKSQGTDGTGDISFESRGAMRIIQNTDFIACNGTITFDGDTDGIGGDPCNIDAVTTCDDNVTMLGMCVGQSCGLPTPRACSP